MKEIRDAVEYFKPGSMHKIKDLKEMSEILQRVIVLRDLAEKVLAAKMPEKKEKIPYKMEDYDDTPEDEYSSGWDGGIVDGYNQAIDDCQIAITGILEDLQQIVIEDVPHQYQDRLLEKLGGVR